MTKYRIQIMTQKEFDKYMFGGHAITEFVYVEANNKDEAIIKAQKLFAGYVINLNYVLTQEEINNEEIEEIKRKEEIKKKAEEAKAKKEKAKQKKIEKDLANGITPEMRKAMTNAKRYETQIKKLEKELAELQEKLNYWNEKAKG